MKTTLDLPDNLVREIRLRALDENLAFNEVAIELGGKDYPLTTPLINLRRRQELRKAS